MQVIDSVRAQGPEYINNNCHLTRPSPERKGTALLPVDDAEEVLLRVLISLLSGPRSKLLLEGGALNHLRIPEAPQRTLTATGQEADEARNERPHNVHKRTVKPKAAERRFSKTRCPLNCGKDLSFYDHSQRHPGHLCPYSCRS